MVTDTTLTSIGFNKLLNEYFDNELPTLVPDLQKRIKSLTIIHINDFLYYNSYLKKLDIEILKYHDFIRQQDAIDSMISFSNYLDMERLHGKKNMNKKIFDVFLKG